MLTRAEEFALVVQYCREHGYHRVASALERLDRHERRHQQERKKVIETQKHVGYEPLEPLKPLRDLKRDELSDAGPIKSGE